MNKEPSRRRKIVHVPHRFVLNYLNRPVGEFLSFPKPLGLPDGVRVLSVHTDFSYDSFAFVIEHESFEEADENCMLPTIDIQWEGVRVS